MKGAQPGTVGSTMGGGREFEPQRRRANYVGHGALAWVVAVCTATIHAAATGATAATAATCPTPAGPANMVVVNAPVPYYSWKQCERARNCTHASG